MFDVYTLVDITATGFHRNYRPENSQLTAAEWHYTRNQQRNWDTVIQLIGLRSQPINVTDPEVINYPQAEPLGFGLNFHHYCDLKVWHFRFEYESYVNARLIRNDFDHVPIIIGLNETVQFAQPCFRSFGIATNIVILAGI